MRILQTQSGYARIAINWLMTILCVIQRAYYSNGRKITSLWFLLK
ncbi:hypothetical protein SXCC_02979 [Gluconacetobacter sp. SXCC-1]|nr:hypothetical protein SXCC_02979 [Gluconacetobacter sp. SXCC-1]